MSKSGRVTEAEAAYGKAIELFTALVDEFPAVPQYPRYLSQAYRGLAALLTAAGRPEDALDARRAADLLGPEKVGAIGDATEAAELELGSELKRLDP
jgi:hypothetical protein